MAQHLIFVATNPSVPWKGGKRIICQKFLLLGHAGRSRANNRTTNTSTILHWASSTPGQRTTSTTLQQINFTLVQHNTGTTQEEGLSTRRDTKPEALGMQGGGPVVGRVCKELVPGRLFVPLVQCWASQGIVHPMSRHIFKVKRETKPTASAERD